MRDVPALDGSHQNADAAQERPYDFCTYFDRNYLTRGLALYQSLERHCRRPFMLWIICFDDETYGTLAAMSLSSARLIRREEFERDDAGLAQARANRSGVEYFWTCTPSVPLFLFRRDPAIERITYVDADLFFYSDPAPVFDELAQQSILIAAHRYSPEHEQFAETFGIYNVGLMTFQRDAEGLRCLRWWRERCLEWCYARLEDGKFGDQKYLDDWPTRFAGVVVLQHAGAGVAPWNISSHRATLMHGRVEIDGKPLIFYHFHGLAVVSRNVVRPHGDCYRMTAAHLDAIYRPYALQLTAAAAGLNLNVADSFARPPSMRALLNGLTEQRYFLIRPRWLSLLLWKWGECARRSRTHVERAEACLAGARRLTGATHLVVAFAYLPLIVLERRYVATLARTVFGEAQVVRYRRWRSYMKRTQQ